MRLTVFVVTIMVCSVIGAGGAGSTQTVRPGAIADEMLRMKEGQPKDEPAHWNLGTSEALLAQAINTKRVEQGLPDLDVDGRCCATMKGRMKRCFEELGDEECRQATWIRRLDQYVPDWDKQGFTAVGDSDHDVLDQLYESPEFTDAIRRSDATHLVLATGDRPAGGRWCVMYITRRLLWLNDALYEAYEGGPTLTTYVGTTPYRHVRVRLYKTEEKPTCYEGEDYCVDVETDDAGEFRVTLPTSRFGKGDYTVAFYVGDTPGEDYKLAASVRVRVMD